MKKSAFTILLALGISVTSFAQFSSEPDTYKTEGGELTVYPINHGTVAFTYNDLTIFVDPFGGAALFEEFESPDIIFITDIHGDHMNLETLQGLETENTTFVAPEAVANELYEYYGEQITVISNGETSLVEDLVVSAIPMYNLPEDESSRHTKGRGNGYIITFSDTKVYISGDTEDIPEMRALEDIAIAFVCMNLPFTMDVVAAASAVSEFQPSVVYPYHHRGQDIEEFKRLVDAEDVGVEVILKNWYGN